MFKLHSLNKLLSNKIIKQDANTQVLLPFLEIKQWVALYHTPKEPSSPSTTVWPQQRAALITISISCVCESRSNMSGSIAPDPHTPQSFVASLAVYKWWAARCLIKLFLSGKCGWACGCTSVCKTRAGGAGAEGKSNYRDFGNESTVW